MHILDIMYINVSTAVYGTKIVGKCVKVGYEKASKTAFIPDINFNLKGLRALS